MTFAWIIRSMPAMPIAESSPPIVVGMRQTSSATSTVIVTGVALSCGRHAEERVRQQGDRREQEDDRQRASRMSSAISFGVFCRLAPSTMAIIRSRNVSPGFGGDAHDEPVREHARAAGHRAAVAAPLTDDGRALAGDRALVDRRYAYDDLAVRGDELPRVQHDEVPLAEIGRQTQRDGGLARGLADLLAGTSLRALRSVSACALPRPSAIASAKFAKRTVNHSHTDTDRMNPAGASPRPRTACTKRHVVKTLPTRTTNITGFRT